MATVAATAVQLPGTGTYRLDPTASQVSFTTRHMFGMGAVKGNFALVSGEISVAEPITASTVTAAASSRSFTTGHAKRDAQVRSDKFLHADAHPQIVFRSTGLSQDGGRWVLRGELTARGGTAPVELTIVEAVTDPAGLTVRATGTVDRYAHGITKMKGMAGRYLHLQITARADRV